MWLPEMSEIVLGGGDYVSSLRSTVLRKTYRIRGFRVVLLDGGHRGELFLECTG